MAEEKLELWYSDRTFTENVHALLNLDPSYAPWSTEKHEPAESLRQFGEGFATPVTSFLDVPFKFDFQQESRMWSKMIGSAFTQGDGSND